MLDGGEEKRKRTPQGVLKIRFALLFFLVFYLLFPKIRSVDIDVVQFFVGQYAPSVMTATASRNRRLHKAQVDPEENGYHKIREIAQNKKDCKVGCIIEPKNDVRKPLVWQNSAPKAIGDCISIECMYTNQRCNDHCNRHYSKVNY